MEWEEEILEKEKENYYYYLLAIFNRSYDDKVKKRGATKRDFENSFMNSDNKAKAIEWVMEDIRKKYGASLSEITYDKLKGYCEKNYEKEIRKIINSRVKDPDDYDPKDFLTIEKDNYLRYLVEFLETYEHYRGRRDSKQVMEKGLLEPSSKQSIINQIMEEIREKNKNKNIPNSEYTELENYYWRYYEMYIRRAIDSRHYRNQKNNVVKYGCLGFLLGRYASKIIVAIAIGIFCLIAALNK